MDMIADRVLDARRKGWQDADQAGNTLRRTMGIAHLGGATLDNEENYLIKKLFTALGRSKSKTRHGFDTPPRFPVWRTHSEEAEPPFAAGPDQRRLHRHHGSNMAEGHPVGFQWVMEAKARGARVFTSTRGSPAPARSPTSTCVRAGTDIAFLGGVINYILGHGLEFREYVQAYTNASFLLSEQYQDTEDLDGLFSGYDPVTASYDPSSWAYDSIAVEEGGGGRDKEQSAPYQHGAGGPLVEGGSSPTRPTPRWRIRAACSRSSSGTSPATPRRWSSGCAGCRAAFEEVCRAWTGASGRERTARWSTASAGPSTPWARSTSGGAIIQLLLGNIGRPGGGIFALRGHASIQGSTDIPTLFNLLPGYLPMADTTHGDLAATWTRWPPTSRRDSGGTPTPTWISLLKEYWGDAATAENDFCFDYLPRINGDHGTYRTVMDMVDGKVSGYFLLGQNPAVGSAHGRMQRLGLANLDWLVVRDLAMIESATFWKDAPEIETGEIVPERCRTEVFFMLAASHVEKSGTFTQTQRMLQWRDQAVEPLGDQRSELWFSYHLGRRLRRSWPARPTSATGPCSTWPGTTPRMGTSRPPRTCCAGSAAWTWPLAARSAGTWTCGRTAALVRLLDLQRRVRGRGEPGPAAQAALGAGPVRRRMGLDLAANRRVLYNRASADPQGRPWSERKALVWWDAEQRVDRPRLPDFEQAKPPDYQPPEGAEGPEALPGDDPFIMMSDGKAWLFAPAGLADGPLPTHYEPHESPFRNLLYGQQASPVRKVYGRADNPSNPSWPEQHREVFPFVFTAARLTEHHTAGGMSRNLPYLSELQPALFVEVSPELAASAACAIWTGRT